MEEKGSQNLIIEGVKVTHEESQVYTFLKNVISDTHENCKAKFAEGLEDYSKSYPLYSQDGKEGDALVLIHYYIANADWYVLEVGKENGGYTFFGITDFHNEFGPEYGYFTLEQLQQEFKVNLLVNNKPIPMPLYVERDQNWKPVKLNETDIFTKN